MGDTYHTYFGGKFSLLFLSFTLLFFSWLDQSDSRTVSCDLIIHLHVEVALKRDTKTRISSSYHHLHPSSFQLKDLQLRVYISQVFSSESLSLSSESSAHRFSAQSPQLTDILLKASSSLHSLGQCFSTQQLDLYIHSSPLCLTEMPMKLRYSLVKEVEEV